MKKNKVKPTKKQRIAFENIERGMTKKDAMLAAGYSEKSAVKAKQNLTDTRGYQTLVEEYRGHLKNAGITLDVLSEIQAEGLFDQNAAIRLGYLKETKRDFGLVSDSPINITDSKVVVLPSTVVEKYGTSQNTGGGNEGQ